MSQLSIILLRPEDGSHSHLLCIAHLIWSTNGHTSHNPSSGLLLSSEFLSQARDDINLIVPSHFCGSSLSVRQYSPAFTLLPVCFISSSLNYGANAFPISSHNPSRFVQVRRLRQTRTFTHISRCCVGWIPDFRTSCFSLPRRPLSPQPPYLLPTTRQPPMADPGKIHHPDSSAATMTTNKSTLCAPSQEILEQRNLQDNNTFENGTESSTTQPSPVCSGVMNPALPAASQSKGRHHLSHVRHYNPQQEPQHAHLPPIKTVLVEGEKRNILRGGGSSNTQSPADSKWTRCDSKKTHSSISIPGSQNPGSSNSLASATPSLTSIAREALNVLTKAEPSLKLSAINTLVIPVHKHKTILSR